MPPSLLEPRAGAPRRAAHAWLFALATSALGCAGAPPLAADHPASPTAPSGRLAPAPTRLAPAGTAPSAPPPPAAPKPTGHEHHHHGAP